VRILTRYILGEISSHSLIGCALFTFILFMKPLEQILEMVVRNSSSFMTVLAAFSLHLPNTFLLSIPMAVLVGVLLGLSRLAADSEITAMRASGFGIWYFVRVASVIAMFWNRAGAGQFPLRRAARQSGHSRSCRRSWRLRRPRTRSSRASSMRISRTPCLRAGCPFRRPALRTGAALSSPT
jgi:hypothetical protein